MAAVDAVVGTGQLVAAVDLVAVVFAVDRSVWASYLNGNGPCGAA